MPESRRNNKYIILSMQPSQSHNQNSPVTVFKTSMFGRIDTLLGSYSPVFNSGNTIDYTVCLPVGTYQLVFVASGVENVSASYANITKVLLTDSPCTYSSLSGLLHRYLTFYACKIHTRPNASKVLLVSRRTRAL